MAPDALPPLLPRVFPRERDVATYGPLIEMLAERRISLPAATSLFMFPGLGFHVTLYNMVLMLAEYRRCGQHTYLLPQDTQEVLRKASLSGIESRDLVEKLPHRAMYLSLPDSDLVIWGGQTTQWHEVRGVLLYHHTGERGRVDPATRSWAPGSIVPATRYGALDFYIWGPENSKSSGPGDDACFWFSIDLQKIQDRGLCLQEYLDEHFQEVFSAPTREAEDSRKILLTFPEGPVQSILIENLRDLTHLVLSMLILLQSPDRTETLEASSLQVREARKESELALTRVKSDGKKRKLQQRLERLPQDTLKWLEIRELGLKGTCWSPNRKESRSRVEKLREETETLQGRIVELEARIRDPDQKRIAVFLQELLSERASLSDVTEQLLQAEAACAAPLQLRTS